MSYQIKWHPRLQCSFLLKAMLLILVLGSGSARAMISADGNNSTYEVNTESFSGIRFVINPPNDAHISVNRFDRFDPLQPLQIFNLGSAGKPAADLIIIESDIIELISKIQFVGPPSDVVFVKTSPDSDGQFLCNNCEFENVNRVLFASAKLSNVDLDNPALIESVDLIETVAGASINIHNLYAPGAFSTDVLTQTLNLSGGINLNQQTNAEFTGGFSADLNGSESIGSGAVTLLLGDVIWSYANRDVVSVLSRVNTTSQLSGTIRAPSVRISSTSPLDSSVNVNTRTDRLAIVLYQGQLKAVKEGVLFETLKAGSNLVIRSTLVSDEAIELRAVSDLVTSNTARLEAQEIKMVVGGRIINTASVAASNIYAAADTIENEGNLSASERVSLKSNDFILNQYGGHIEASFVELLSTYGVVRNGAKTPYKSDQGGGANAVVYDDNYVSNLSSVAIGVFYQPNTTVETSGNYVLAPKGSASIVGNTVQIRAAAVENINPYYAFSKADGKVVLDVTEVNKVRISAEKTLLLVADNYILNSSAIMQVNDSAGVMGLQAPLVNNERYRVEAALVHDTVAPSDLSFEGLVIISSGESIGAEVVIYSPPGLIASMGELKVKASSALLNNTAYIEVYGNAAVDTPTINNIGLLVSEIGKTNMLFGVFNADFTLETIEVNANELDTLFFVQGSILANQSTGWFHNHEPLEQYILETIDFLVVEDLPHVNSNAEHTGYSTTIINPDYGVDGEEFWISGDELILQDSYQQVQAATAQELAIAWIDQQVAVGGGMIFAAEESGIETYDLFEALKRYYDALLALLTEFTNELDFWN